MGIRFTSLATIAFLSFPVQAGSEQSQEANGERAVPKVTATAQARIVNSVQLRAGQLRIKDGQSNTQKITHPMLKRCPKNRRQLPCLYIIDLP